MTLDYPPTMPLHRARSRERLERKRARLLAELAEVRAQLAAYDADQADAQQRADEAAAGVRQLALFAREAAG